jgi:hypothetical protein
MGGKVLLDGSGGPIFPAGSHLTLPGKASPSIQYWGLCEGNKEEIASKSVADNVAGTCLEGLVWVGPQHVGMPEKKATTPDDQHRVAWMLLLRFAGVRKLAKSVPCGHSYGHEKRRAFGTRLSHCICW